MNITQGEWGFKKWDGYGWPEKRWSVGVKEKGGVAICISPRYSFEIEESESNAKLISAAPELFAACAEFVRKCDVGEARSKHSYAQMKAAIEKATKG